MISVTKAIIPILTIIVTLSSTKAQEVHVYYNLQNEEIIYRKEGVIVKEPKIKQGDDVVLQLAEFNHYLHTVEIEVSQEHFTERSSMADASLMSGFMPGMPIPSLGGGVVPFHANDTTGNTTTGILDIPLLTINNSPITLMSLFKGSRGSGQMLQKLETTTQEISTLLAEMNVIHEEIKGIEETATVSQLAIVQIETLKTHPHLKPSFVKGMCEDFYKAIFRKDPKDGIELDDVLQLKDDGLKYQSLTNDLRAKSNEMNSKVKTLTSLAKQYRKLEMDDEGYRKYAKSLAGFLKQSDAVSQQLEASTNNQNTLPYPSVESLTKLQVDLAEIISNDFIHHSRFQATGDRMTIEIKLLEKPTDPDADPNADPKVVKTRWLYFDTKGGLKFTGSVGLNFSQFFDPAQDYSVQNGVIVGEDEGAFTPTVTSFLHFYSYTGKKVSLGGSFGIGFPLSGSSDNQSLQFFAGPTLIFGSTQRFLLNFGLMGGRKVELSKGLEVGDEFDDSFGDLPTRSPYDLGLFIGASFNLGGG